VRKVAAWVCGHIGQTREHARGCGRARRRRESARCFSRVCLLACTKLLNFSVDFAHLVEITSLERSYQCLFAMCVCERVCACMCVCV